MNYLEKLHANIMIVFNTYNCVIINNEIHVYKYIRAHQYNYAYVPKQMNKVPLRLVLLLGEVSYSW